jgi:hypothetical protein
MCALAGLLGLFAGSGRAADFDVSGFVDARLIVPSKQGSYAYGDLGKLRYGYDSGSTAAKLASITAEARLHVAPELLVAVTGRIDPNYGPSADLIEAYACYAPPSTGSWRWSVKAGAFFPPGSQENDQIGWTSAWTITPSAINSWIGYELRTIGAEGRLERRPKAGTLALTGAIYGANDPSGVLIADRGWSLDDRVSGLFEQERIPDAMAVLFHTSPPLHADEFREIDNAPGWYVMASWRDPGLGDFSLMRYDNNADPSFRRGGQFAWRTDFWNAGYRKQIDRVTLLAQAMSGSTEIEPAPGRRFVTHFSSAFVLGGLDLGDWRLAARGETFRTHTLAQSPSVLSENGYAGTLAVTWYSRDWLQLTAESIVVGS